jgi:hypothetical protein
VVDAVVDAVVDDVVDDVVVCSSSGAEAAVEVAAVTVVYVHVYYL